MSSRLVSRAQAADAQPMTWTVVRSSTPAVSAVPYITGTDPAEQAASQRFEGRFKALEEQAARRIQEAREAGRREGEAAGRLAARQDLQPVFDRLGEAIQHVAALRPELRAQAESDLVKLAIAIARRIVYRELATDPDAIAGLARVALEKVRIQELIRVGAHPDHIEPIRAVLVRLGAAHVELAADPVLERGGVKFETTRGQLDISIETQLREIDRGLADRLGGTA
jgi:flagellar assembly protein FliH